MLQTFVAALVGDEDLPNAVALNASLFTATQMVGPAAAGLTIATIGIGWALVIDGASFGAVMASLCLLRAGELRHTAKACPTGGSFIHGLRYVRARPDLMTILLTLFLIGTFGMNFPIFTSTMAVRVFHADAQGFGLLASIMAVGALTRSLVAAARRRIGSGRCWAGPACSAGLRGRRARAWLLAVYHGHGADRRGRPDFCQRN